MESRESHLDSSSLPRPSGDETEPLLRPSNTSTPSHTAKPWVRVVITATLIILFVDLGSLLVQAPLARLFESILCSKYWAQHDPSRILPDGSVPEELCKVNSVQDTVAVLFGWQWVWDACVGLPLAIPYGNLADRWGRKPVLWLCAIGFVLNLGWILFVCYQQLPLYAVWFSSAFLVLGGGSVVGSAMIFTVAADVAPHDKRTSVFLWMHGAMLSSQMAGPAISSALMRKSNWLPLIFGFASVCLTLAILPFLPETLHHRPAAPLHQDSMEEQEEQSTAFPAKPIEGPFSRFASQLKETVQFMFHDRDVALAISSFMFGGVGVVSATILLQYVSKRYHWRIADAALLGTLRAAVNLVLFLFVLPATNNFFIRRMRMSIEKANLEISKWSAVLMCVGFLIVGLSPNVILMIFGLVIYTFGTGLPSPMRSVCIALIGGEQSHRVAQLFATLSMSAAVGIMIAGPLLPVAFHWGQKIGGMGLGFPFLLCALMMGIVVIEVFLIRLPAAEPQSDDDEHEEIEN